MKLKANKKGELDIPVLKFYTLEDARRIRQYSLDWRADGSAYLKFYDAKGKVVKITKGIK